MDILNFTTIKTSISETFKINTNTFISTTKSTYRKKLDKRHKMLYKSELVAKNTKEIIEIESFLTKNITKLIIQPIYSTLTKSISTEFTQNFSGDFYEPFCFKDSFLLYGNNIENLQSVGIIDMDNNGNIVVEYPIQVNQGDLLIVGKTMTLSKSISINKISNTYWKFQISTEEL